MWINSARNTASNKHQNRRKALSISAFLVLALLLYPYVSQAGELACKSDRIDKTAHVKFVIDGDTLVLDDGSNIRLIGINAPEINYETRNPEPFAEQAKEELAKLVQGKKVNLRYDTEKRDRYQRILAHVFLEDGTNVNATLLENGLAAHIVVPPNVWQASCYHQLDTTSMKTGTGMWTHERFRPKPATTFTQRQSGFYIVSAKIADIRATRHVLWLDVDERFSFRIENEHLKYFKKTRPESLKGHSVIIRGWVFPHGNGMNMRVQHPLSLQIID